ncbi:hypothetical protein GCM10023108_17680 [Saccharopolyspora hordei]
MWRIALQTTRRHYAGGVLLLLLQADPTGLSTPLGRVVIGLGLLATVVVLVRLLWQYRNRR